MAALVFDASPLSHFARAGRLETLERLTAGDACHVTRAVMAELDAGVAAYPRLGEVLAAAWLRVVAVDEPRELNVFAAYARSLVVGERNLGEASTLAWAEVHGALAVVDDLAARKLAHARGVSVRGSIGLVMQGVKSQVIGVADGRAILQELHKAGARLPSQFEKEYDDWAAGL